MKIKNNIICYSAIVHFKNMGINDNMFEQESSCYGGYAYLMAKTDSELTFRKIIENYADAYKSGIIAIEEIQQEDNSDIEGLDHYLGIYSNNITNTYDYSDEDNSNKEPYHYPILIPVWRSADVILKNCGKGDELFSKIEEAKKAKIHVLAKTTTEDLFVRLIENYVIDYNSEIVNIDYIKIEESINNVEMVYCEDQYMGIYSNGTIKILD